MRTDLETLLAQGERLVHTGTGESMLPFLRPKRDVIIVERPVGRLKRGDVALYKRELGKYILHRVLRVKDDGYVLCGDNQWRREYGVTDAQIVGVLTAFVRDGKEISVTDRRYRLYARLWCDLFPLRAAVLFCRAAAGRLKRRMKTPDSGREKRPARSGISTQNKP